MKVLALLAFLLLASIQPPGLKADDAESNIRAALAVQVEAWNRGDIPAFVTTYAEDCIFVGKQVAHGKAQLLTRYQKTYPTREAMGHLTFHSLNVHLLTKDIAIVTGEWHIERTSPSDHGIGGLFSLVFQRQSKAWKIALDHTS